MLGFGWMNGWTYCRVERAEDWDKGGDYSMMVWSEIRGRHFIWCYHPGEEFSHYRPLRRYPCFTYDLDDVWSAAIMSEMKGNFQRLSEEKIPFWRINQRLLRRKMMKVNKWYPERLFLPHEQYAWSIKWPSSRELPIASKVLIGTEAPSFSRYEPSPGGFNGKSELNRLFQWWECVERMNKGKETIVCNTWGNNLSVAFILQFWCNRSESSILHRCPTWYEQGTEGAKTLLFLSMLTLRSHGQCLKRFRYGSSALFFIYLKNGIFWELEAVDGENSSEFSWG